MALGADAGPHVAGGQVTESPCRWRGRSRGACAGGMGGVGERRRRVVVMCDAGARVAVLPCLVHAQGPLTLSAPAQLATSCCLRRPPVSICNWSTEIQVHSMIASHSYYTVTIEPKPNNTRASARSQPVHPTLPQRFLSLRRLFLMRFSLFGLPRCALPPSEQPAAAPCPQRRRCSRGIVVVRHLDVIKIAAQRA